MPAASDKAYEILKHRVVAGGYAPGAQLKEEHLARELDISRTPIRAALKRLVEDGLATAEPGRGVRVAEWTESDIQETFEVRGLLEGHAAELAARRGGAALADTLDTLNAEMEQAIATGGSALPERLQVINAGFHRAILDASGSPRLRTMLAGLIDMPIVIRSHFISTPQDKLQSLQHHRELAVAVRAGDAELARQVMQLHLRVASHRFKAQRSEFTGRKDEGAPPPRRRAGAGSRGEGR
jgi:DNA-binding GntR family transcriptional regulator